jgi:hypothetical protein
MVDQSDWLPMMMATTGAALASLSSVIGLLVVIGLAIGCLISRRSGQRGALFGSISRPELLSAIGRLWQAQRWRLRSPPVPLRR